MTYEMGLYYGLPDYDQVLSDPQASRELFVEWRVGRRIDKWLLSAGAVYVHGLQHRVEGRILDAASVRARSEDRPLTRVESTTDMPAGSFFYDPRAAAIADKWGKPNTRKWGDGLPWWGLFPRLFIRLQSSGDPNATEVVALLAIHLASRGVSLPALGDDMLAGIGDFET